MDLEIERNARRNLFDTRKQRDLVIEEPLIKAQPQGQRPEESKRNSAELINLGH